MLHVSAVPLFGYYTCESERGESVMNSNIIPLHFEAIKQEFTLLNAYFNNNYISRAPGFNLRPLLGSKQKFISFALLGAERGSARVCSWF